MLQLMNISKDFAGNPLFTAISWHLKKGERVALVGENGAGKSTLMKIIAGLSEPTSGEIQLARGAKAAYLPQDGIATSGRTLFHEARTALSELLAMEEELHRLGRELERLPHDSADHPAALQRYGDLQEQFRHRGGYTMEAEIGTVLKGLGFSQEDWQRDCGEFSGGWQMRIALARLLLQKPDVLLLDEPTNHLDIEARNWLEEYLCSYPGSVILVSHDRFFMDRVCSRISEVWNHTITDYHCSYSNYLVQREERVTALREAKRRQDEEIEKSEDFIRRFRYQANKASLVQSRIKQLERVERIVLPPERKRIRFHFPPAPKSGKTVMELRGLTKAYGDHAVLDRVDLVIEKGERIALVGHNGAGKSTLMSVLAGAEFQGGERIEGHNLVMDYFAQDQASVLDAARSAYDELYADAPYDMVPRLRDILGAFLFSGDDIHKKVGVLSGGERNRLALAKMLLRPSNLLLMDEPTNHLDLFSKEVLLDALRSFDGTVVFVSHDRYFVNGLATRIVEVDGGALVNYFGDYEYYREKKERSDPMPTPASGATGASPAASRPAAPAEAAPLPLPEVSKEERKRGREEEKQRKREEQGRQKQLAAVESEIARAEAEIARLEVEMNGPGFFDDPQRGAEAGERHAALNIRLEELYGEWEGLSG
ncbi:ABC-F family ATP-binding cassette domain-containing protein [Geobacter sp. FeAm09]|uniref:ABC-F family ATP-binding cassette domain-containing protein n=1 Tax=Geobacter sp. FeAm09 TaxID=2597769 RepID=UPI0011ED0191|nr:ABC-F family ATP-binding cassette domain-containing protein [Geobacter sp. FeAm09]QEM69802.1 ABC-F family ATP-binding cassette domain-containing protein [Geobacter sp. FeAm09]